MLRPPIDRPTVIALALGLLPLAGCASGARPALVPATTTASSSCAYTPTGDAAKPVQAPDGTSVLRTGKVRFTLKLTGGAVRITSDRATAPCAVASFESLAKQGFYTNTSCHRLSDAGLLMLQCGDPTGTGRGGPGYTFADELNPAPTYPAGTVAMANAGANTNGSQFFFVYGDSSLAPAYTVLGHLDEASIRVIAAMAAEGQDASFPDGTGNPTTPLQDRVRQRVLSEAFRRGTR